MSEADDSIEWGESYVLRADKARADAQVLRDMRATWDCLFWAPSETQLALVKGLEAATEDMSIKVSARESMTALSALWWLESKR